MYRSPKSFEMKIKIAAAMGSKTKTILGLHCHPCLLMKVKRKIHGYYFDGKKSWVMYEDEHGKIILRRWNDE